MNSNKNLSLCEDVGKISQSYERTVQNAFDSLFSGFKTEYRANKPVKVKFSYEKLQM